MGLGIACVLLYRSGFAAIGEPRDGRSFVLFMGVAMSITAMPVLAAIVRERGLAGTTAGVVAMAVAGTMDVLAWLVLAAALIGTGRAGRLSWPGTVLLIGGFLAGLVMRAGNGVPDADVVRSLEQAGSLLLPLFFIVTGLSLNIGDVRGDALILLVLIVLIASAGKLGPATAGSRRPGPH